MTVFQAPPNEHLSLARHLTAERKIEERVRKQNHWLDALYNACAAGSLAGVRLIEEPRPSVPRAERWEAPSLRPDGLPWINSEAVTEVMKRYIG